MIKQTIKQQTFIDLHKAVNELSLRCDGAAKQDGHGFNGADSQFGKQMAMLPYRNWSDKQAIVVYGMLAKYKAQLSAYGVDYEAIEKPSINTEKLVRRVEWNGKKFILKFEKGDPDFKAMLEESRELPGRYFNWETSANEVIASNELKEFAKKWKFTGNAETHKQLSEDVPKTNGNNVIELAENGKLVFIFDFSWEILESVKAVPGRAWEECPGYKGKVNTMAISELAVKAAQGVAKKWKFAFTEEAERAIFETLSKQQENLEASRAADSDFEVEGINGTPYPFQKAGAAYLVNNPKCFLADEMGLGKTIQGLMAIKAVGSTCSVIIVPASLKLNWAREAKKWLGIRAVVLNGRKGKIHGRPEMVIANYDIFHHYIDQLRNLEPDVVICDESHRLKNHRAIRSKAADDLVNGHLRDGKKRIAGQYKVPYVWFLTGTPVLNRPNELLHPLSIMGALGNFGGFWEFARRYIGARQGSFGLDMSGAQNLPELNQKLRAYGLFIRRTKEQVLPELPDKQWATIPVTLSNDKEYRKAEKDVISFIGEQSVKETEFIESVKDLPEDEKQKAIAKYRSSKEASAARAKQLTEINALKQLAARGKMKEAINWIDDFLTSGEKLIVFAYHRFVTEHLAKHYDCPFIIGGMPSNKRQDAVDAFQNDPNVKLIVCNIIAAGEGLTLTAASNELFLEFPWTPAAMDQASDRAHRIGQKNNVTAWQMIGENSIDEKVVALIETKRSVVNAVTEGDDAEAQGSIYGELVEYLMEKKA